MANFKLGWRNPRNATPILDFQDLEKSLAWPHFVATVDDAAAIGVAYTTLTLTDGDDPWGVVDAANDRVRAPDWGRTWWVVCYATARFVANGAGVYSLRWTADGVGLSDSGAVQEYSNGAANETMQCVLQREITRGSYLQVQMSAPAATTVDGAGSLRGFFMPMY